MNGTAHAGGGEGAGRTPDVNGTAGRTPDVNSTGAAGGTQQEENTAEEEKTAGPGSAPGGSGADAALAADCAACRGRAGSPTCPHCPAPSPQTGPVPAPAPTPTPTLPRSSDSVDTRLKESVATRVTVSGAGAPWGARAARFWVCSDCRLEQARSEICCTRFSILSSICHTPASTAFWLLAASARGRGLGVEAGCGEGARTTVWVVLEWATFALMDTLTMPGGVSALFSALGAGEIVALHGGTCLARPRETCSCEVCVSAARCGFFRKPASPSRGRDAVPVRSTPESHCHGDVPDVSQSLDSDDDDDDDDGAALGL